MKHIAIFASGSGTNAENIIRYFKDHPYIKVSLLISNKRTAPVIEKAKALRVPVSIVDEKSFFESTDFIAHLTELNIKLLVLAGFLWKIPDLVIQAFPDRIINIHPSLLPKYGGKGMYGNRVHKAVLDARETEAGISIHLVNEHYDEGKVLFQEKINVQPDDTVDTLSERIHRLEHTCYPKVIEHYLNTLP